MYKRYGSITIQNKRTRFRKNAYLVSAASIDIVLVKPIQIMIMIMKLKPNIPMLVEIVVMFGVLLGFKLMMSEIAPTERARPKTRSDNDSIRIFVDVICFSGSLSLAKVLCYLANNTSFIKVRCSAKKILS
jgi:hypothetical protein